VNKKRGRDGDPDHETAGQAATVTVAVVSNRIAAELIASMLRGNGVGAVVLADDAGGQEPALQAQGVRVLVAPSDAASARQLLSDR
jgi:predicted Fe-Mo cluster-binding NifX family protein